MALYTGYSSNQFDTTKSFIQTNVEIVKTDLYNHIFTLKGERVMMPTFGTRIPELTFEPLDEDLIGLIREDLTYVFDYDPRVRALAIDITPYYDENRVEAICNLLYIELNMTDRFALNIEFQEPG